MAIKREPLKITRLPLLLVLLALSWLPLVTRAQQSPAPKRVLVLYWYDKVYQGQCLMGSEFSSNPKAIQTTSNIIRNIWKPIGSQERTNLRLYMTISLRSIPTAASTS